MTRGERLKQLIKFRKISQERLAELVGISQGAITKLQKDKVEKSRYLYDICKVLNCNIDWLEKGEGLSPFEESHDFAIPTGMIPILSWAEIKAALNWTIIKKNYKEYIPMFGKGGAKCYALRIQGDSMVSSVAGEQTFLQDEIIVVDPDKKPKHGDFVIVLQKGTNQAIFKQYLVDGVNIYLSSLNQRYPTIPFDESIVICGVVIGKHQNFD